MKLDPGSSTSAISQWACQRLLKEGEIAENVSVSKTYNRKILTPLNAVMAKVTYNSKQHMLNPYVVKQGGHALFGRGWLRKIQLDWQSKMHLQA